MDAARFDHLTRAFSTIHSRRRVLAGVLAGAFGASGIRAARATHTLGHHCTPSDRHACPDGQPCRKVDGRWTCVTDAACTPSGAVCDPEDPDPGPCCDPDDACVTSPSAAARVCCIPPGGHCGDPGPNSRCCWGECLGAALGCRGK